MLKFLDSIPKDVLLPYLSNRNCPKNKRIYQKHNGIVTSRYKPALVYYIKFTLPSGLATYKIGYTSTLLSTRIAFMQVPEDIKVTVLSTYKTKTMKQAFALEQYLHSIHQSSRYLPSPPFLSSGNTELYLNNPLSQS
jgi:hypothetical protein